MHEKKHCEFINTPPQTPLFILLLNYEQATIAERPSAGLSGVSQPGTYNKSLRYTHEPVYWDIGRTLGCNLIGRLMW